jgi:putative spermidine/putrescine transport system permease protein
MSTDVVATMNQPGAALLGTVLACVEKWGRILLRALALGLLAFVIFGPIMNMLLWTVAESWYFPAKWPVKYGFTFWERVFSPRGNALESLFNSVVIAFGTVCLSLALAIPAGYAIARLKLPWRGAIMLMFLLPQAFPNLPVYINVARIFYGYGLNGTFTGVVLVHTVHGLVYAIWIATAAFAAVDRTLEEAARISGAGPLRGFFDVTLPLAMPGLMASAIFVFLESLDEFTATFFVGVPQVNTLPLLLYTASGGGNYQVASITALILLVPSIAFMLLVERFLKADVLAKVGH